MRIKKVAQGLLKGLILNTKSDSTSDAYSCDYINNIIAGNVNDYGQYIYYPDGTLITSHQVIRTLSRTTEWGNMYETDEAADLGGFPAGFKDVPYIFVTLYKQNAICEAVTETTKDHAGKMFIVAPTINQSADYIIQVFAIGRWK